MDSYCFFCLSKRVNQFGGPIVRCLPLLPHSLPHNDGWTYGWMDRSDRPSYRDARTHLKRKTRPPMRPLQFYALDELCAWRDRKQAQIHGRRCVWLCSLVNSGRPFVCMCMCVRMCVRARMHACACGYLFGRALVCVRVYICARVRACMCVSLSVVNAAPLNCFGRTISRMTMKLTRRVLSHSDVRSLVHSHHTLIRFLQTA